MKEISLKKIVHLIMILALALGQACEGPEGPAGPEGPVGPEGPTGPAGPSTRARVIEFPVDFERTDNLGYNAIIGFDQYEDIDLTIGESDVVVVYTHTLTAGTSPDQILFWSPLPHVFNTSQGQVRYQYAFSEIALVLLADAQFDLANTNFITERLFRLVIVPGENMLGRVAKPNINFSNYNEVARYYNITEKDVEKVRLKK